MSCKSFKERYLPLLVLVTPGTWHLILLVILMLVENGVGLCSPWLAGQFSEVLLGGHPKFSLTSQQILLSWFGLIAIQSALTYSNKIISGTTSERMVMNLRKRLYDHLQNLPISFYHDRKHGTVLSLLSYDTSVIGTFVSSTMVGLLPHFITAVGALVCIYLINPPIALFCALLIPVFVVITKLLGRTIRPYSTELMEQYGTTFSIADENLRILPLIKSFSRELLETKRYSDSNEDLFAAYTQYIRAQAKLAPLVRFLASAIIITFLFVASDQFNTGNFSTGDLVSLMLYGLLLTRPISSLAESFGQTQRAFAAAKRISDIFLCKNENLVSGATLPPVSGKIEFNDVSFGYQGREQLFRQLNLTIQPGETIAITGKNGAGKSTIAHLIMRLHTPQSGTILIDDIDIQTASLDSLRSQIGLVQQNVLLRNSSVKENLLFGRADASMDEIVAAAKSAHALEFINNLPDRFDTHIGDQGIRLSGGQKQRLALARALLKNPAILILDEATAMFDPEGEADFIRDNLPILQNMTVIIITHRPASLSLADRIYELREGLLHFTT